MNRRGYTYFDWNVSSGDAQDHYTAASVYRNVINGVHRHSQSVILCHNTGAKGITLSQIPKIIQTLQNEGYQFETLDQSVDNEPYIFPIQF
jgi:peptidoglycan/xylan/chitin deacetylase (PgdA/CDA1 family)